MRKLLIAFITLFTVVGTAFSTLADPLKIEEPSTSEKLLDKRYFSRMPSDIVLGAANAPITMIEYSSLSCPHCAHFQKEIFPDIKKNYIETGKVLFIHRDFPLDDQALKGSILVHCAGEDRYYTFLKVLFDKQDSWAYQKNYIEILSNIGKLGGISGEKFDSCMKDKALENSILETKLGAANAVGITSTPTFIINGKKYNGANSYKFFDDILKKEAQTPSTITPTEEKK